MKVTFLGTGTSTGVPMVGCSCNVCRSPDPKNTRSRASLLLQEGERSLVIDVGPDFRRQALSVALGHLDAVLLTHGHSDHILGLDDLRPLSWKRTVPVWTDAPTKTTVEHVFPYFFVPGDGKTSRPQLEFHRLEPLVSATIAGFPVLPLPIQHGGARILGFRVGPIAYLTDCNGVPDESRSALRDLDVLVLGALRPSPHPTHFSLQEACATAAEIGARRTLFTHCSHDVDHSVWESRLPTTMGLAYDGLSLEVD